MGAKATFTRRKLPHWQLEGATYFVTFRLKARKLSKTEVRFLRDHLASRTGVHYDLVAAVVMPDHVHLLLRLHSELDLSRTMKSIKGVTARRLNTRRGTRGTVWQAESFDRVVRDRKEIRQKLEYMFRNPVTAGIVNDPENYYGWFLNKTAVD